MRNNSILYGATASPKSGTAISHNLCKEYEIIFCTFINMSQNRYICESSESYRQQLSLQIMRSISPLLPAITTGIPHFLWFKAFLMQAESYQESMNNLIVKISYKKRKPQGSLRLINYTEKYFAYNLERELNVRAQSFRYTYYMY